jgi:prepilin-type N-terminal cleavage/methylation domain-containing protein
LAVFIGLAVESTGGGGGMRVANYNASPAVSALSKAVLLLRRAAFTLIEMLVVIAVIGILAALLLPVLSKSKDTGERTIDLNNLRQMMIAVHLYATDNRDVLPWANWASGDKPGQPGWLYTPPKKGSPKGMPYFQVDTGLLWPTLHNSKLYICPEDGTNTPLFNARPQKLSSYAINGAINGYARAIYPALKLGDFPPRSIMFWETDERFPQYFNDGANYPAEGVSKRHINGGIYAAADASASFIRFGRWYAEEADTNKNRLWCYPGSANGR